MVLVDSSVWIAYFRDDTGNEDLDHLITDDAVATNDLILAELLPGLRLRRQNRLISLLQQVAKYPVEVDWDEIVEFQLGCLRKGINKVGIPDLIVAQNTIQNGLELLTRDKHFQLLTSVAPLSLH